MLRLRYDEGLNEMIKYLTIDFIALFLLNHVRHQCMITVILCDSGRPSRDYVVCCYQYGCVNLLLAVFNIEIFEYTTNKQ